MRCGKARTWPCNICHIVLGIKESRDHLTNESLYYPTGQAPLRETILEHQLKFTGLCIRMPTDAKRFFIFESKIRPYLRPGPPWTTYLNQMSLLKFYRSRKRSKQMKAVNKSKWSQIFVVSKKKKVPLGSS